jgi:hypothetical protein
MAKWPLASLVQKILWWAWSKAICNAPLSCRVTIGFWMFATGKTNWPRLNGRS